jgi:hypothetical protein
MKKQSVTSFALSWLRCARVVGVCGVARQTLNIITLAGYQVQTLRTCADLCGPVRTACSGCNSTSKAAGKQPALNVPAGVLSVFQQPSKPTAAHGCCGVQGPRMLIITHRDMAMQRFAAWIQCYCVLTNLFTLCITFLRLNQAQCLSHPL